MCDNCTSVAIALPKYRAYKNQDMHFVMLTGDTGVMPETA